ncbi:hypothetical protein G6O67_004286 [Ophiocordyceps sinensis]|uniref:Uncharacterized protein n=1 Tax=Ophiocordyceps sinensis TaxID=72228 RepID=A0A8H4M069_9HYPO|nr:hypothetical protein G6O67_004286 [Ophiocordyceps sinensis]
MSSRSHACSMGMQPAHTPEATMDFGKRAPSSLLHVSVGSNMGRLVDSLCPVHEANVVAGVVTVVFDGSKSLDGSHDAKDSIITSSKWLGVEMAGHGRHGRR